MVGEGDKYNKLEEPSCQWDPHLVLFHLSPPGLADGPPAPL